MKILHTVENYHPSKGGMQEVVKRISEELVLLGHSVTVATSCNKDRKNKTLNGVKIEDFNISGNMVNGIIGNKNKYLDFIKRGSFDIVTNFAAQQWATDLILEELDSIKSKKVFVPTGFSGLFNQEYEDYFNKMKFYMKKYDMNIFLSDNYRDINFARKNNISKIKIIPNGASFKEFSKKPSNNIRKKFKIPKNNKLLIHVGSHTELKGHRELIEIFRMLKTNNISLLIIGNTLNKKCSLKCNISHLFFIFDKNKQLIIKDLSRDDTINLLKESDLFIFPSNIECSPIVLFEASASKTPFISTDVGNSKEIIKWLGGGVIMPTIKKRNGLSYADIHKSAKMIDLLLKDEKKLKRLSINGYEKWKKKFTWEKISRDYESLYKQLVKNKKL